MNNTGTENKEGLWSRMESGAKKRWSELTENPGSNPKIRSKGRRPKGAGASRGKRAPQKRPRPGPKSLTQKEAKAVTRNSIYAFLGNFEKYIKSDGYRDDALRSKTLYREGMSVYIPDTVSFGQIVSKPIMSRGGDIEFDVSSGNSVERHRKVNLLPEIVRDIDVVSGRLNDSIAKAERHGTEVKFNMLSDATLASEKIINLRRAMQEPGEGRSDIIVEMGPARTALEGIFRKYKSDERKSGGVADPSTPRKALARIDDLSLRVKMPDNSLREEWANLVGEYKSRITLLKRSKGRPYSSEGHGDYDGGPRTPVTHLKGGGRTSNPAKGSKRKLKKYKLKRDDSGRVVMPGADLRNADLREHDLERANFEGADLEGADFFRADIFKAKFGGANLRGADFLEAYLWGTDLSEALNLEESKNLHSANFLDKVILPPGFKMPNPAKGSKRKLKKYKLKRDDSGRVVMPNADLRNADLRNVDLGGEWRGKRTGADLEGAILNGADLYWANLEGANLHGAWLDEADLSSADLRGAHLNQAYLTEASLQGAILWGAWLQGAYLPRADLRGAFLEGAFLEGAELWRADFGGANLEGADLYNSNLNRADLRGAKNLDKAKNLHLANNLDKAKLPPGFKMPNPAKGSRPKKASAKKAEPTAKELISKCRDLFEAYKKKPGRARLNAAIKQCDKMKGSKFKTVKEERARCMRGIRREKKRLGIA